MHVQGTRLDVLAAKSLKTSKTEGGFVFPAQTFGQLMHVQWTLDFL